MMLKEKMKALARQMSEKRQAAETLLVSDSPTKEQLDAAAKLLNEADSLKGQYDLMERSSGLTDWLDQSPGTTDPTPTIETTTAPPTGVHLDHTKKRRRATPLGGGKQAFIGEDAGEKAYGFGMWFLGGMGYQRGQDYCIDHGYVESRDAFSNARFNPSFKALAEGDNTTGGALVPTEWSTDLISLLIRYGVFRQYADVVPMERETKTVPRRTGGVTVYYPGEAGTITASNPTFDNILLTARKQAVLTKISSEVNEDSIIDLGNRVAFEIAYAMAKAEDNAGFIGDGTSTYGGMIGITTKLLGLSATIANIAGLFVGTGNLYSELVLTDFENTAALLPDYADDNDAAWYVNRAFYYSVMLKLALAAGGVTKEEVINGQRVPFFLGYPVRWANAMPKAEGNSQVCAILGNLMMGAMLGTARTLAIATSEHADFASDQITVRGTQRVDVNVHDVGNADATAANRQAGPIVGLITAAS